MTKSVLGKKKKKKRKEGKKEGKEERKILFCESAMFLLAIQLPSLAISHQSHTISIRC